MKLSDRIRNFFYAVTHANQLIAENAELKVSLDQQAHDHGGQVLVLNNDLQNSENEIKMWKELFSQALPEQFAPGQAKELYDTLAAREDPDGFSLFHAAEDIWGKFPNHYFAEEIDNGIFIGCGENDYNKMMDYFISYLQEAYPSFAQTQDAMYINAMVRMGILGQERHIQITPDPLPQLAAEDLTLPGRAKETYYSAAIRVDPDGSDLFLAAEEILNEFNENNWYDLANKGYFEFIDGHRKLRYLLFDNVDQLGFVNLNDGEWKTKRGISFFVLNNPTPEYRAFEEQLYQKLCRKLGLVAEIAPQLTQLSAMPVGRIDYYSPSGKVGESIEYSSEADFIAAIKQDNYCGVPMGIVVYSDPVTGKHMDTSWRLELDPPPLGFSVEPCPAQAEPEQSEPDAVPDYEYEP